MFIVYCVEEDLCPTSILFFLEQMSLLMLGPFCIWLYLLFPPHFFHLTPNPSIFSQAPHLSPRSHLISTNLAPQSPRFPSLQSSHFRYSFFFSTPPSSPSYSAFFSFLSPLLFTFPPPLSLLLSPSSSASSFPSFPQSRSPVTLYLPGSDLDFSEVFKGDQFCLLWLIWCYSQRIL